MTPEFRGQPIGWVRRAEAGPEGEETDHRATVALEIAPECDLALTGIEEYSHLLVVAWFDRAEGPPSPDELVHPDGREEIDPVGRFATRTPRRPNPLAVVSPRLLRRDGRMLWVTGIDLWDGTPILDIKGYALRDDCHPEATVPQWLSQLWADHDRERGQS